MTTASRFDHLVSLRRDLHRHPEPAWREFYTTSRVVDELERIGVDEIHLGRDVLDGEREELPEDDELDTWFDRARESGAREDVLERIEGGYTGAVAVLRRGDGPTVGLRVDIDGLPREESTADSHVPAAEGFRSETGAMHACGHDAHIAIGIGVLEAVKESDFQGTLKVFFQPAEEVIAGGSAMVDGGHVDDVDYLFALHIGLDHPTGEIVAGVGGFLAVAHLHADFAGEASHAGNHPEDGRNAVLAAATGIQNLYAIPRHNDGATRVNAGIVGGGTATNIVAEDAYIRGEVRGKTTELMDYVREHAERVLDSAAEMHDCDVDVSFGAEAPSGESDEQLADVVGEVAGDVEGVDSILPTADLGGSEDATYLMRRVQENGGLATYVGVGTDHPGGHHSATFDVDETSIGIGVETLAGAIQRVFRERP